MVKRLSDCGTLCTSIWRALNLSRARYASSSGTLYTPESARVETLTSMHTRVTACLRYPALSRSPSLRLACPSFL
eukprot:4255801-Pleurochrysis_carterae.AAC.2